MEDGCFVRAVFGDYDILNFGALLEQVKWTLSQPQPEPTLWYCYGEETRDYLRSLGLSPVMLTKEGYCTFGLHEGIPSTGMAMVRYGSSIWRHKYPCVRDALSKYSACIWLDLDTVLARPLPETFWEDCRKGPEIQSSLMRLNRRQTWWRPEFNDNKYVPTGACIYFGTVSAIETVLDEYERKPEVWDLPVLAKVIDKMMGGWHGPEAYRDAGYEFPLHLLNKSYQVFTPDNPVLVTSGRRLGLTRYAQIAKREGQSVPFV